MPDVLHGRIATRAYYTSLENPERSSIENWVISEMIECALFRQHLRDDVLSEIAVIAEAIAKQQGVESELARVLRAHTA